MRLIEDFCKGLIIGLLIIIVNNKIKTYQTQSIPQTVVVPFYGAEVYEDDHLSENNQCRAIDDVMKEEKQIMDEEFALWKSPLDAKISSFNPLNNSCVTLSNMTDLLYQQLNTKKSFYQVKKEVKIAIIDTGIDYSNPAFNGRIFKPTTFNLPHDFYGFDLVNQNFAPDDKDGHGTHVAGIIVSLFPEAKILPIKFYENRNTENMSLAIKLAVQSGVDIINISGGGEGMIYGEMEAIKQAQSKGIIVIAAAGNDKINLAVDKDKFYPASYQEDNIISVMAHDSSGAKASFSNYGYAFTDISALGQITSFVPSSLSSNCIGNMSGTSQATPVVTAAVGILMASNPHLSYKQIKSLILKSADVTPDFAQANRSQGKLNFSRSISGQLAVQ